MFNPAEIFPAVPLMLAAALPPPILPAVGIVPLQRRRNIDTQSKDRLLKFFIRKSRFVDWSPLIRNAYIIALLATTLFSHLSRNQVLRVYEQYEAIKQYSKEIGTHVVDNTKAMIYDPLKSITLLQMIGILAEVYMYFTLPENFNGLPDKLFKFLHSCQIANHRNALGLSLDLNAEELSYIESFIIYYKFVLLQSYINFWELIAKLEHGDKIITGGNMFVYFANMEYEIKDKRDAEIANKNGIYQCRFYENTAMKALYTEISKENLYKKMNEKNAVLYPRYAESAVRYDSRVDFKLAFLKLFEELCYNFYSRIVAMIEKIDTNNTIYYDDDDDDDVNTELNNVELEVKKNGSTKGQFTQIHLSVTYYTVGAAFNAMLGIFNTSPSPLESKIQACILSNLSISLQEALKQNLPCSKINALAIVRDENTNEIRLICATKDFFNCIVALEEGIIIPVFNNVNFLARVGSTLYHYVRSQLCCHDAFSELCDLFENSISSIIFEDEETKECVENMINDILEKFVEYYLGARFNDYTQVVLPKVNFKLKGRKNNAKLSLGFRTGISLGVIK